MKLRFAAIALAACLLSTAAHAADGPSAADRATARALAAEGHKAFDARDFVTAADRFARADALVHAPTLMLHLARSQAALGHLVAANEAYNQILREGLAANASKVFQDAVEEARKELATITPRLSWVTVTVTVTGEKSTYKVVLDGAEIPAAAIGVPRAVDSGNHVAIVTAVDGIGKAEATVTLDEGRTATLPIELKVKPFPPGMKPPPPQPAGGTVAAPPPPPPPKSWAIRRTAGFVGLGVGGAGIVVGAITGSLVLGLHGTLAVACGGGKCPASQQSTLDSYNRDGLISTISFIAGGTLAAAGAVLVLTVPSAPKAQPTRVGLTVVPAAGGGTFSAVGSF